jgi:hypothetical protein
LPSYVDAVYSYNAAGFDPQYLDAYPRAETFFALVRNAEGPNSNISSSFNLDLLNNLIVPEDYVHLLGSLPGAQLSQFSEGGSLLTPLNSHDFRLMNDALLVYDFLSIIDPDKSASQILTTGIGIFKASASNSDESLEAVVKALATLFSTSITLTTNNGSDLYTSLLRWRINWKTFSDTLLTPIYNTTGR